MNTVKAHKPLMSYCNCVSWAVTFKDSSRLSKKDPAIQDEVIYGKVAEQQKKKYYSM